VATSAPPTPARLAVQRENPRIEILAGPGPPAAERHRAGAELVPEAPRAGEKGGQVVGWGDRQLGEQRLGRLLGDHAVGLADQRGHRGRGSRRLQPRAPLGHGSVRRRRRRRGGDDADDLVGDLYRDSLGDGHRGGRVHAGHDHARVGDDRRRVAVRERAGGCDDGRPERGDGDRHRAAQGLGDRGRDGLQIVAGDRAGDQRQRRGPGSGRIRSPARR
jgi:hypothetical protein